MTMKVKSSNIASIGHQGDTLRVKFKGGAVYNYSNVPEKVFQDMQKAESPGKFLAKKIKGAYSFKKEGK